ncbi:MAG: acetolactate synthase large subunit, partial [Actinomycetota bacterium]|nr:acetolactate synthase large subunit [Actinomycetota bacterium]
ARDVIDERADVAIPMAFTDLNNLARNEADVVLAVGTRFGETDWWGKAPYWKRGTEQRMIQVDSDDTMLGLNKPVDVAVLADANVFLTALADELENMDLAGVLPARRERLAGYMAARGEARAALDGVLGAMGDPVHSAHVAPACQDVFGDDAVMVADGGNTAIWAQLYHEVRAPHSLLSTYKFGMLGAGVAQALGAKVADPGRIVYCITGDGAFGFHPQEIETAVRNDVPVIVLVLADRAWGMVKVNQEFALNPEKLMAEGGLPDEERINTDLGEIRYDLMAQSMGAYGARVSSPDELRPALQAALDSGRPAVIHIDVDRTAHKFAPSLLTFKEMHAEPAG